MKKTDSETTKKEENTKAEEPVSTFRYYRDSLEIFPVALILAFLFKAFIIELYCIPTGSMASTLMGRHKDVNCEICNFPFQLSASQESNEGQEHQRHQNELPRVIGGTCPQCQYTMYVGDDNLAKQTYMSYSGDRIFVNKSLFSFREPGRWHVTVFRYPAKPQTNYIKRLIGLENETVMLRNGQVFTQKEGDQNEGAEHWEIQRKPLRVLLALLRPVDDNDYVLPAIHELGWKTRWYSDDPNWQRSADYKSFTGIAGTNETAWLNFRYITATTSDWLHLLQDKLPPQNSTGTPQLITDSLAYNTNVTSAPGQRRGVAQIETAHGVREMCYKASEDFSINWVGDLVVRCTLQADKAGVVSFRLVKGGITFQCDLDLVPPGANAHFSIPDVPEFAPFSVHVPLQAGRDHDVMFCHVDEEMRLIVDGKEVDLQGRGRYDSLCMDGGLLCRDRSPTELDLTPVSIGILGGKVHVNNLKVMRNMYYISCDDTTRDRFNCDLIRPPFQYGYPSDEESIKKLLSTPALWEHFGKTYRTVFKMGKDQFLMCGDNSAQSQDSRLWTVYGIPHYVERKFLIGEAIYVFWPHGHRIPGTRFAFIPNFQKMRWID